MTLVGARKRDKKIEKKVEALNTPSFRVPLCEIVGHPTNMFPELDEIKALLHSPNMPVNSPPPNREKRTPTHYKALYTNHACPNITPIIALKSLEINMH